MKDGSSELVSLIGARRPGVVGSLVRNTQLPVFFPPRLYFSKLSLVWAGLFLFSVPFITKLLLVNDNNDKIQRPPFLRASFPYALLVSRT